MIYLSALIAFFVVHILPFQPTLRLKLIERLGERKYKAVFRLTVISIVAIGVYGWNRFPNTYFYEPSITLKQIHLAIMLPTVYLWVVAETPNNLKRYIRHPMLTGMKLWALGHLLANGDLRSLILFICFLLFSVVAVIASNKRGPRAEPKKTPIKNDILVLLAALGIYFLLVKFHGNLFGMPVIQYF